MVIDNNRIDKIQKIGQTVTKTLLEANLRIDELASLLASVCAFLLSRILHQFIYPDKQEDFLNVWIDSLKEDIQTKLKSFEGDKHDKHV